MKHLFGIMRPRHALPATVALAAVISAAAVSGSAAAGPNALTCEATALQATVFGQKQLDPLHAGSSVNACTDDTGGAPAAGESVLKPLLGADGVYAITKNLTPGAVPSKTKVEARSGAAEVRLDPTGNLLKVQAVEAESQASCVNGAVQFSSTSRTAKLFVFGQEVPVNDGVNQLVTALDGVTKVIVHVRVNEVLRSGDKYTFRALHVSIPQDGSLLDVIVGQNTLSSLGMPCTDDGTGTTGSTGTTGGPGGSGTLPQVGTNYGGGKVIKLSDLPGFNTTFANSPCAHSSRFGRRVAIIGTNGRDTITGSDFRDRIFSFGAHDVVDGGNSNDCIEAGSGGDNVSGGPGNDYLFGRSGVDFVDGGRGNDRSYGGTGNDRITTGSGKDYAFGGPGNDRITTKDGGDHIYAGSGNDLIFAAHLGHADVISCGSGRDIVRVDAKDKVSRDCEVVLVAREKRKRR